MGSYITCLSYEEDDHDKLSRDIPLTRQLPTLDKIHILFNNSHFNLYINNWLASYNQIIIVSYTNYLTNYYSNNYSVEVTPDTTYLTLGKKKYKFPREFGIYNMRVN